MMVHVQYQNARYDFVNAPTLDRLLKRSDVRRFYRPSEKRWVFVDRDHDPIRGSGGRYSGPERRHSSGKKTVTCASVAN